MTDSLAMRGANAATGFALSSLLVCGVIVVSDTGTYAIPLGNQHVPSADAVERDAPTVPADAQRSSTRQTITVPVTLRPPRQANGRGGAGMALPASALSASPRPERQQTSGRSGDSKPGRGSFTSGASPDRPNRAEKTSSRRSATPARESRDTAPARSAFRSGGSRTAFRRGA